MDVNQNNDELQKAIDGITGDAAATAAGAADLNKQIQDQMGVPPVPPVDGVMPPEIGEMQLPGAAPAFPAPETPAGPTATESAPAAPEAAPIAPEAPAETTVPEAPAAEPAAAEPAAPAEPLAAEPAPAAPEAAPAEDLSAVKAEMMKDLFPLMDKVQLDSDEKFGIYKEMIDTTHDDGMIPDAYAAAKGIADETKKAEALLYLIRKTED